MKSPRPPAVGPWTRLRRQWWKLAVNTWREQSDDDIGLIAAGVAFYGFLALVPLLGALVLSYGFVATPETVLHNVQQMANVMPTSAAKLVGDQLLNVVGASSGKKGAGLLAAIALALFGARNGAGAIITALNISYEQKESRSFVVVNLIALAITIGAIVFAILVGAAVTVIGHLEALLPVTGPIEAGVERVSTYVIMVASSAAMAATLYRFGPVDHDAHWVWLTPGSALAATGWLILTLGFGAYAADFGHYDATYGSLSAVIVLLTWLYLSSYVFLLGAEMNSELEKLK